MFSLNIKKENTLKIFFPLEKTFTTFTSRTATEGKVRVEAVLKPGYVSVDIHSHSPHSPDRAGKPNVPVESPHHPGAPVAQLYPPRPVSSLTGGFPPTAAHWIPDIRAGASDLLDATHSAAPWHSGDSTESSGTALDPRVLGARRVLGAELEK